MKKQLNTETEPVILEDVERIEEEITSIKLTKDLRKTAQNMTRNQARTLVGTYYMLQKRRMRAALQIGQMEKREESHDVLDYFKGASLRHEKECAAAIACWAETDPMCQWATEHHGVGPIIAAALSAYIDIDMAPTAGHIWRFAGLDPTCKWEKGQKRPHCASLKVACWKLGESFVKVSGNPEAAYAQVYLQRKAYEQQKNEAGDYAEQAEAGAKRVGKKTAAHGHYITGKLPPGHIHARAKRYAVKLFLSHWHAEAYRQRFGKEPPLPYPIAHLNHAHAV